LLSFAFSKKEERRRISGKPLGRDLGNVINPTLLLYPIPFLLVFQSCSVYSISKLDTLATRPLSFYSFCPRSLFLVLGGIPCRT